MKFKILSRNFENSEDKILFYDNETNDLIDEHDNKFEYPEIAKSCKSKSIPFSKDEPLKKSKLITRLKIQLGLSCNYSCSYCSQKFQPHADETSSKHVDSFIKKLDNLEFNEEKGLRIEIWGGEPLVYWKTIKPLVEKLNEKFDSWNNPPKFSMITNGSLLTRDISDWLIINGFSVSVSHDGPGQSLRGPDPFDDPEKKANILYLYKKLKTQGRFSFGAVLNQNNTSRKAILDYFIKITGDPNVPIGEGGFIDAYDEDGYTSSEMSLKEHFNFRRQAFNEIKNEPSLANFNVIGQKINGFINSVLNKEESKYLGQKCGMDNEHILAVDLNGNVITCQNTSAVGTAGNGFSHLSGKITDIENVRVRTSTHWKNRPDCSACPVLHICQGSCMFLEDKYWEMSCKTSYTDSIVYFAYAIYLMTNGFMPYYIEPIDGDLPRDRRDIFGNVLLEHQELFKEEL